MLDRHRGLIAFAGSKRYAPGLDRDDFESEALHGFYKAVRDYRSERGVPFGAFAKVCVERQVDTALKTARRGKHEVLNLACSLDAPVDTDDGRTLAEVLPDASADVLEVLETKEDLADVLASLGDTVNLFAAKGKELRGDSKGGGEG